MKNVFKSLSRRDLLALAAGASLLLTLVLRYLLIEKISLNWDEYKFLEGVHLIASGEQTRLLQTAHGHLFSWVLEFPGHEVDHVIVARHVMFLLTAACAGLLVWLGRRLIGGSAGAFAGFVYGSFAYVLHHSASFRYDTLIVTCYLGGAAALVASGRPRLTAALAGFLAALALTISIKSAFLVVPLAVVASLPVLHAPGRTRALVRLFVFGASGLVSIVVLLAAHGASLAEVSRSTATIAGAAGKMIDFDHTLPQAGFLVESLRWDTPMWVLLLVGLVIVGGDLIHRRDEPEQVRRLQVLALAAPLATLYFYRNSFPYYYVTVMPGACLLAGYVWRRLELMRARPVVAGGLAVLCGLPVAWTAWQWYAHNNDDDTAIQRYVIETAHEIFEEPVAYIDRCAMLGSFDKVGPFMSTWVMSNYRAGGRDIIPDLLRRQQPKFVLANSPALELHRPLGRVPPVYRWRRGDYRHLQANFVHHWGPIWVAGKSLAVASDEPVGFEILIPGPYTVEASGAVEVDGSTVGPGDVVELEQGQHTLRPLRRDAGKVILRWGDRLPRPEKPPVHGRLFRGFVLGRPPS